MSSTLLLKRCQIVFFAISGRYPWSHVCITETYMIEDIPALEKKSLFCFDLIKKTTWLIDIRLSDWPMYKQLNFSLWSSWFSICCFSAVFCRSLIVLLSFSFGHYIFKTGERYRLIEASCYCHVDIFFYYLEFIY